MMIKFCIYSLAATGLLSSNVWALPFDSVLSEDVDVSVGLRSMAEAHADWEGHPFAEVVNDPELQKFLQPFWAQEAEEAEDKESFTEVMENEFGLTWEEFFDLFPGQMSLSLFNLPELVVGEDEEPELVLLAEFSGDHARMAEIMDIQFKRNAEEQKEANPLMEHTMIEEKFMGETLHFDEAFDGEETYIEDGYALVDGIFILATPESRLRSIVEAIKEGPDAPIGENSNYLLSREFGGCGDFSVYLNLEEILPPLNEVLLEQAIANGAAMFGLSAQSLDKALSLEAMQAVYVDVDLIEEGLSTFSGIIYREKAGLLSLLTYGGGALPEATYVPERVFSTSVTTFDVGAMVAQLEKLLTGASPSLPALIDMQMQNVRTQTGVDLRTSILENFGGNLVSLSIIPEYTRDDSAWMQPEQVNLIELHDADALSGAIKAMLDLTPGSRKFIETQEFAGQTIYTIKATPDPNLPDEPVSDVSYVITRSHFMFNVGPVGLLQEVLTRMESGEEGFWQQENTEWMFDKIAKDRAVSRSFVDLERMIEPIFHSMLQASQLGGDAVELDESHIPKNLKVPFFVVSEVNEEADGMFSRSLISKKEASE